MKKKGLIISTIVMVVVLIASLTTATYAWFTTSSKTEISGFNVEIAANNAVNIGVKSNATFEYGSSLTTAAFRSGSPTFAAAASKKLGGTWSAGTNGLTANLTHGIKWGSQSKAVAASTNASPTVIGDFGTIASKATSDAKAADGSFYIFSANGDDQVSVTGATIDPAVANTKGSAATDYGDYAYLFLGVTPTRQLDLNNLVIVLDMSNSPLGTVGIMSAIHIAYRTCMHANATTGDPAATSWFDAELVPATLGSDTYGQGTEKTAVNKVMSQGDSGSNRNAVVSSTGADSLGQKVQAAYGTTFGTTSEQAVYPEKSFAWILTGLSTTPGYIDEIELVIYIDGTDADCVNAAIGASGVIKMFFLTEDHA